MDELRGSPWVMACLILVWLGAMGCSDDAPDQDCVEGAWSEWSACSAECDGGEQVRTRPIQTPASGGGLACGDTEEIVVCNEDPCDQDCVEGAWSEWSACSAECDGGEQVRTRPIQTPASGGGLACGDTEEIVVCNEDPCDQDCVEGAWSEWSACSAECDGGEQVRTRPIQTPASGGGLACGDTEEILVCNEDPCVRINHIQVIGTHNSYKEQPSDALQAGIDAFAPPDLDPRGLVYTHVPLAEQLESQSIRQFELDVWRDPNGGLFAEPFGPGLVDYLGVFGESGPDFDPFGVMVLPGFKVFHVQDIDFRGQCLTLASCLEEIRSWSADNRDHVPIAILFELKADEFDPDILAPIYPLLVGAPDPEPAFTIPFAWELQDGQDYSDSALQTLESEIRAAFADNQLLTPDMVRGDYDTMMEAITSEGWPKLSDSRGRIIPLLDNGGALRASYVEEYPGLRGALFFVSADPESPEAAYYQANDPFGSFAADSSDTGPDAVFYSLQELVERGFMLRSRADADNVEPDANDTTRMNHALSSGAHWVSTDYPVPAESGYVVTLPGVAGDASARCNPRSAPASCTDSDLLE